jgi:hypothetical protein
MFAQKSNANTVLKNINKLPEYGTWLKESKKPFCYSYTSLNIISL